jgi:hypothetical protein
MLLGALIVAAYLVVEPPLDHFDRVRSVWVWASPQEGTMGQLGSRNTRRLLTTLRKCTWQMADDDPTVSSSQFEFSLTDRHSQLGWLSGKNFYIGSDDGTLISCGLHRADVDFISSLPAHPQDG